jgi:DNA invertase Pin-like site-specific DNA recombinase
MRLALIYVRQSRHKESERTVSPEVQEQACRQLPAVRRCDEIAVYRDLDKSGKSVAKRPDFQRFLERIERDRPDVIAVYDQSRSFRNTTEALDFYALMERLADVEVVFQIGLFERSPVGEFSYTTLAAAHTMERKMTGAKIRSAYRFLNAKGAPTGQAPYGYRRTAIGAMEPVEDEAAVVLRMFRMYTLGVWSAHRLAGRLNDEGVTRPGARSRHGWLPDTVIDTLRNVAYIGKTYSESRAKAQGELINAQWQAIVDEATFWRAQELLGERKFRRSPIGRLYVFGRLLFCSECGEALRSVTDHGVVLYHCRRDVAQRCPAPRVREDVLMAWASALFQRVEAVQPDAVAGAVASVRGQRRVQAGSLDQVEGSLQRLEKLFVWGHIAEDEYLARRADLAGLRVELEAQAEPQALSTQIAGVGQAWQLADEARRRQLLSAFFEKLYVRNGGVTKYVPRREYRQEVEALITLAVGNGLEFDRPVTGRGANLTRAARAIRAGEGSSFGGKGGIRTHEGASNPLPA